MKLLLLAALVASSAYAHDFKTCGTDNLGVTAVDVQPDSPIPGQNLTVAFSGTPKQDIVAGDMFTVTAKVFGVALGHIDFDLCKDVGLTCPVKAGTASVWSAVYPVPKEAPSGIPLTAEFTSKTLAGTQYSCIDVDVTMGSPPSTTPVVLVAPMTSQCFHHTDVSKCYEACGEGDFVVPNLEVQGPCADQYNHVDASSVVNQCSDGVTNIKYCTGGDKHVVALTVSTKAMVGACFHSVQDNRCSEACADAQFVMTGVTDAGTCPTEYGFVEKTEYVEACSDGLTNIKYCTHPLYAVNVTMRIKGEAAPMVMTTVNDWTCLHNEDAVDHKCYEACAQDSSYSVKGLTTAGACPVTYSQTDSTKTVQACSDGVTNLKYCAAGGLHQVTLIEKIKGMAGINKAYWAKVAAVDDQTTLYKISGDECGEASLDSQYAPYAEKFAGLTVGTCASVGYTVADGSQSINVPVLGAITISKFKKASVMQFNDA